MVLLKYVWLILVGSRQTWHDTSFHTQWRSAKSRVGKSVTTSAHLGVTGVLICHIISWFIVEENLATT